MRCCSPYVQQANALVDQPRFYNTITANCTTIVFDMLQTIIGGLPVDYRLLLTGYLPAYVMSVGGLQGGYSLDTLRQHGRFTERARMANDASDFPGRSGAECPAGSLPPIPATMMKAETDART